MLAVQTSNEYEHCQSVLPFHSHGAKVHVAMITPFDTKET